MLYPGLYEQVINNALNRELAEIPEARKSTAPIDTAEAAKVLAQYLTDVVQKGLENVQDNGGGIEAQIQLAKQAQKTLTARRPLLRKVPCLPALSMSRRCTRS